MREEIVDMPLLRQGQPLRPKSEGVSSTFCESETSSGVASRSIILYSIKCTNHEDWYSVHITISICYMTNNRDDILLEHQTS